MTTRYELIYGKNFERYYKKLTKKDQSLQIKVKKALGKLMFDPYDLSLRTHKAQTKNFGRVYSSKITGDMRVIWDFHKDEKNVIIVHTIGGHSGGLVVYK